MLPSVDRFLTTRRPHSLLIALCLALWLPGFFTLPASDRDESRFAQATKQMIETGNYVQIRNGPAARYQKPIGIYWIQAPFAAAARAIGLAAKNPIWPYRLPSLLGGIIAVIATYRMGRRSFNERTALLAAVLLATSMILAIEVHTAKTDAALLAATAVAMGLLGQAYLHPRNLSWRGAAAFWAALGAGILLKGPIEPLVVGLTVLSLSVLDRHAGPPVWLRALRWRRGLFLLLAIVAPWFLGIGWATHGDFFAQSVGGDLAGKLVGSNDAHGAPFGTHVALIPVLLFAGAIPLWCAIPGIWSGRDRKPVRFLAAWIAPSWLVFECVATKLPHYTLPLYPALALLAAEWMLGNAGTRDWLAKTSIGLAMVASTLVGLAALALPFIAEAGWHRSDLLGVPAFMVGAGLAAALVSSWPNPRRAAWTMLAAAPLFIWTVLGGELPGLSPLWIAPRVQAALSAHWPGAPPALAALGFSEPSLMFLCGTRTALLSDAAAAAGFLAEHPHQAVLVDDGSAGSFNLSAVKLGLVVNAVARITGYNYSRGRRVSLILYTD